MDCTESSRTARHRPASSPAQQAIIVGAGPNGLSAGIVLAEAGVPVLILERNPTIGGGARTAELTLPGFKHDICSAIHPLAAGSPFFRRLPLEDYGLEWLHPPVLAAHPLEDDGAALYRSPEQTAGGLQKDAKNYRRLMQPLVSDAHELLGQLLAPLRPQIPSRSLLHFGFRGLRSADAMALRWFQTQHGRGLFAGMAAHSMLALDQPGTAAFALTLMLAGHTYGWPLPKGGSQAIVDALAAHLVNLGGRIETEVEVRSIGEFPSDATLLFDTTPHQMLAIVGDRISGSYRRQVRNFRYGPGIFKVDYALDGPIPWFAPACRQAGTVHLGGTFEEVGEAEAAVSAGLHPQEPFVLVAQQSLFDPSRAPTGKHTAWAYCHVPSGSSEDMTGLIEDQIERYAPGFRSLIIGKHVMNSGVVEEYNPNYIGGDIGAGANTLRQLIFRPAVRWDPYSTPDPRIYLCSASTPPGGGVHGMAGYHAAQSVLRRLGAS